MLRTRLPAIHNRKGSEWAALLLTNVQTFKTHWSRNGGQLCPGRNCPVCEAWPARERAAAIVHTQSGVTGYFEWPFSGDVRPFAKIDIKRDSRGVYVKSDPDVTAAEPKRLAQHVLWQQMADLYRLPEPSEDDTWETLAMTWRRVMTKRLKTIGDECR